MADSQKDSGAIVGYHLDGVGDWVAELDCGHNQHVRHTPPWFNRPWVITVEGREQMRGHRLSCRKCERNEPRDWYETGES